MDISQVTTNLSQPFISCLIHCVLLVGDGIATRYSERRCVPGQYCVDGRRFFCDAGRWGGEYGQNSSKCSGECSSGYYCPEGSTSSYEVKCGDASKYCPQGSSKPQLVPSGYYSIGHSFLFCI